MESLCCLCIQLSNFECLNQSLWNLYIHHHTWVHLIVILYKSLSSVRVSDLYYPCNCPLCIIHFSIPYVPPKWRSVGSRASTRQTLAVSPVGLSQNQDSLYWYGSAETCWAGRDCVSTYRCLERLFKRVPAAPRNCGRRDFLRGPRPIRGNWGFNFYHNFLFYTEMRFWRNGDAIAPLHRQYTLFAKNWPAAVHENHYQWALQCCKNKGQIAKCEVIPIWMPSFWQPADLGLRLICLGDLKNKEMGVTVYREAPDV
jgi:hypothetical protein